MEDCNVAIMLDPTNARAHLCRAYGNFYLQRFSNALEDYERASRLQPENTALKEKVRKAKEAFATLKSRGSSTQNGTKG